MCLLMLFCNSKIRFLQLGPFKLIKTIKKRLNVLYGLSPAWIIIQRVVTIHGLPSIQLSRIMDLKIEVAKNKCLGAIWSTEVIPIA